MKKLPLFTSTFFKKYLKQIVALGVILALLIIIKNIIVSIFELQNNSQIVVKLKTQEERERQQEQFLKERLYYAKTPEFIERQAREKLGMVKEGEYIVLAPPTNLNEKSVKTESNTPNWEKWWKLFF